MQATFTKERLMPYREKGYSNREIAKAVGCAYQTVLNKLGPQDEQLTILMQEQRQKKLPSHEPCQTGILRET